MLQKQLLRLGGALHGDALAVQVAKTVNVAGRLHYDHLTAVHIRPRPAVEILSAVHGEAAPEAVHVAALQKGVLILPVDFLEARRPAQSLAGGGGDLHVDTGELAVFVQIEVWLVVVAAHGQHRQGFAVRVRHRLPAGAQHRAAQRQQRRCSAFCVVFHSAPPAV